MDAKLFNVAADYLINQMLRQHGIKLPRKVRGDDMPLRAEIVREKKGKYAVIISFAKSRRHYGDEIVFATNVKEVKAHIRKLYPTLLFKGERVKRKKGVK